MGGACSRKRYQHVHEDDIRRVVPGKYCKTHSSKWLGRSLSRCGMDVSEGRKCPTLMELSIHKLCEHINEYNSFSMIPRDISQQVFNELIDSHLLTDASLEAFRDCAIQDVCLGEYPGVRDSWMNVVASQGPSLLSVDISASDVTDSGIGVLKDCPNLQSLTFNYCYGISDSGMGFLSGMTNLTSLSFKKSSSITAQGMSAFAGLVNLINLDFERCSGIHGGFVHLKGLMKLETLNVGWCNCITNSDVKALSAPEDVYRWFLRIQEKFACTICKPGLTNLRELQLPHSKVSDDGVVFLRGMKKLHLLNMEGCPITAACLESISGLVQLSILNMQRCNLSDDGCDKFSELVNLKVLNIAFNNITDECLKHLKGLTNLESLNLDSCKIRDEGMVYLEGMAKLRYLELSDSDVGNNGLRHLSGLSKLESVNLSFTLVNDIGLRRLSGLTSLKSLNLDSRQITDTGLASLTSLTGLTHLDLFGARITDFGTNCFKYFKNLRSLELCGGGITDAGAKNIKELTCLTLLNLSQNCSLTDKTLESISRLTALISLNVSGSRITNAGLHHLKLMANLRSLSLESCKVTATEIKKLQLSSLPNLVNFRPK